MSKPRHDWVVVRMGAAQMIFEEYHFAAPVSKGNSVAA